MSKTMKDLVYRTSPAIEAYADYCDSFCKMANSLHHIWIPPTAEQQAMYIEGYNQCLRDMGKSDEIS